VEEIEVKPFPAKLLGTPAAEEIRYRATYEKKGRARFLGHNDLINAIRRSFRRAGVAVLHSKGFHPKMRMSFLPALPLGMEGLAEALEFRSDRLIEEQAFLAGVNACLPEGVRFLNCRKLCPSDPALNEDATGFIYSLDLSREGVQDALKAASQNHMPPAAGPSSREHALVSMLAEAFPETRGKVAWDEEGNQLFLRVDVSASRCPRPQGMIKQILGLENPVFHMKRTSVQYRSAS
jgi:radical SAM-linked protein